MAHPGAAVATCCGARQGGAGVRVGAPRARRPLRAAGRPAPRRLLVLAVQSDPDTSSKPATQEAPAAVAAPPAAEGAAAHAGDGSAPPKRKKKQRRPKVPPEEMPLTEVSIMLMAEADRRAAGIASPLRPTVSPAQVAWDQFVDSLEDVGRHLQRSVKELPSTQAINRLVRGEGGRLRLQSKNPVVLILGSGWGAHSIIKVIDTDQFDVICVSPTNHFLFTPMLPSTAVGTIEFRSLTEAIREANPFVDYYEATCNSVDVKAKVAVCASASTYEDGRRPTFEVPYDVLVVAIGEKPATFGVPGVEKHCFFMKQVPDAVDLRKRIAEVFELAALPGMSDEDKWRLLHFVVVGGGPTGVEFAGTLSDFVREDLKWKFPELMPFVRVSLFNSGQAILMTFDSTLQQRALENFKRTGVEVRLGMQVTEVKQDVIVVGSGEEREEIPYGVCVWSAGNAPWPLITQIANQIPEQAELSPGRPCSKLSVDPFLRVIGARDIISLGDCSRVVDRPLPTTAQVAAQQGAYAAHLVNRGYRLGRGGITELPPRKPVSKLSLSDRLHRLADLDVLLQARVASNDLDEEEEEEEEEEVVVYCKKPFNFLSLGIMAYVGNERALTQIDMGDASLKLSGQFAFLVWKSVYITKQVSFRNRVLILFDWLKTRVFGRDTTSF